MLAGKVEIIDEKLEPSNQSEVWKVDGLVDRKGILHDGVALTMCSAQEVDSVGTFTSTMEGSDAFQDRESLVAAATRP